METREIINYLTQIVASNKMLSANQSVALVYGIERLRKYMEIEKIMDGDDFESDEEDD